MCAKVVYLVWVGGGGERGGNSGQGVAQRSRPRCLPAGDRPVMPSHYPPAARPPALAKTTASHHHTRRRGLGLRPVLRGGQGVGGGRGCIGLRPPRKSERVKHTSPLKLACAYTHVCKAAHVRVHAHSDVHVRACAHRNARTRARVRLVSSRLTFAIHPFPCAPPRIPVRPHQRRGEAGCPAPPQSAVSLPCTFSPALAVHCDISLRICSQRVSALMAV